jgi:ribosomal protein L37AE/L43A
MFDVLHYVEDLDLANEVTVRRDCPICRGIKTFTASNRDGFLVWNCYKAGCKVHGGTQTHMTAADIRARLTGKQNSRPELFAKPEHVVSIRSANTAVQQWLHQWDLGVELMWDVKEDRIVFPIYDGNVMVDATGRAFSRRLPKWKRYGNSSIPYVVGDTSHVVIVEDCMSAAVVAQEIQGGSGIAIMGTSLSDGQKNFMVRQEYTCIVVALDPDALPKTLGMAKELHNVAENVKVLKLKDDLKYRNLEDIKKLENVLWN